MLTLSSPVVSNGYASKCSGPYWFNPPFHFFDTRALRCSVLSARVPECQNIAKGGLDQYGIERFDRLTFATIRQGVRLKGLTEVRAIFSHDMAVQL